ncbi:MAG: DUF971 domain-containing protein [Alphaproteobacteria bacterium]|nr:DUF971 domain-containing protein [Alphaproteobacteria bacterium]
MTASSARPWPRELRYRRADRILEIDFDTGEHVALPAELLRVESPSAEVQGHGTAHKVIVSGKRQVGINAIDPVGNYAVRIHFDDGHASGLYSWDYLHELGRNQDRLWADYLTALAQRNLSREP